MAFFEDLTAYTYFHPEEERPGTVNIGWLSRSHPFPIGRTALSSGLNSSYCCNDALSRRAVSIGVSFAKGG